MTTKEYIESWMPKIESNPEESNPYGEFAKEVGNACIRKKLIGDITQLLLHEIDSGRLIVASELPSVEEIEAIVVNSSYHLINLPDGKNIAKAIHNRLTKRS